MAAAFGSLADVVSAYLPVLLMGLLALGTWWLVRNTPQLDSGPVASVARHVADYTMNTFTIQRFGPDGSLRVQLQGDVLRHYPDTDTLEIDNARILSILPGGVTRATARLARSNSDGSDVQLMGGAHVVRQAGALPWTTAAAALAASAASAGALGNGGASLSSAADALEFHGEFLQVFQHSERLRSHLPVTVTRGGTQLQADTMEYDNLSRVLALDRRVRVSFAAPPARRASSAR